MAHLSNRQVDAYEDGSLLKLLHVGQIIFHTHTKNRFRGEFPIHIQKIGSDARTLKNMSGKAIFGRKACKTWQVEAREAGRQNICRVQGSVYMLHSIPHDAAPFVLFP